MGSTGYTTILYTHMNMAKLALFSAILAGLLSLTLQYEVSEQNGNSTMITENQAIPVFKVYKNIDGVSNKDCEAACENMEKCDAWTWIEKRKQCRLRSIGFKSIDKKGKSGIKASVPSGEKAAKCSIAIQATGSLTSLTVTISNCKSARPPPK